MATAEPMTGVLRADVELLRGEVPLLFDRPADAYYRIPPAMLNVAAFLTESMPVSQFLAKLNSCGMAIEREELLRLLAFLHQHHLLAPGYGQIGVRREQQAAQKKKTALLHFSAAYLFFRLPPWRPERFFAAIRPYAGWLASKQVVLALLVPALVGYLLALREFGSVRTAFLDSLSWAGLAKYFSAILLLKIVHEAAHSLAAIHFGCRVRGIGVGFMVFYPRLYTDTTDSLFRERQSLHPLRWLLYLVRSAECRKPDDALRRVRQTVLAAAAALRHKKRILSAAANSFPYPVPSPISAIAGKICNSIAASGGEGYWLIFS